jgi:hypothetical protein
MAFSKGVKRWTSNKIKKEIYNDNGIAHPYSGIVGDFVDCRIRNLFTYSGVQTAAAE